jgi:hypothetical protein
MVTGNSQRSDEHDEVSVLVRSLALSTAKLWDELFERMDRLEAMQRDLRTLVTRIGQVLPDAADELRAEVAALEEAAGPKMDPQGPVEDRKGAAARHATVDAAPELELPGAHDATSGLPPVWTPAPLAHMARTDAATTDIGPACSKDRPALHDVAPLLDPPPTPADPPARPLAVPPPPAGYVVFRVPSAAAISSITPDRVPPGAAPVPARTRVQVFEGPRPHASPTCEEIEDGRENGPTIAPNFSARAVRRRH